MKLYFWQGIQGNFGDELNPWLWNRLLPGVLDDDERILFLGIGTVLNNIIPENPHKVVFGSGFGYGTPPVINERRWHFYCVRGPQTAQKLGLPPDLAITDPAALLARIDLPKYKKKHKFSYIPHHTSSRRGNWSDVCQATGINYIDPLAEVETVISSIASSEVIITEAMHGAVIADALRVPWIPVRAYNRINRFKWNDWCASLKIEYNPFELPALWSRAHVIDRLEHKLINSRILVNKPSQHFFRPFLFLLGLLTQTIENTKKPKAAKALLDIIKQEPNLSSDHNISEAIDKLQQKLEIFQDDLASGVFSNLYSSTRSPLL
jgi:succinoglycan biosynthesis protein ExoV